MGPLKCDQNKRMITFLVITLSSFHCTAKPVYKNQPGDPNIVTVGDRWSLYRRHLWYMVIIYGQ